MVDESYVNPMVKKNTGELPATRILDYPDSMSQYERESLAGEAQLAVERKIKKQPKPAVKPK
jgi:hypothetical protein